MLEWHTTGSVSFLSQLGSLAMHFFPKFKHRTCEILEGLRKNYVWDKWRCIEFIFGTTIIQGIVIVYFVVWLVDQILTWFDQVLVVYTGFIKASNMVNDKFLVHQYHDAPCYLQVVSVAKVCYYKQNFSFMLKLQYFLKWPFVVPIGYHKKQDGILHKFYHTRTVYRYKQVGSIVFGLLAF